MFDAHNHGLAEAERINVHQRHDLRYWTKKLGCTADQLREAVWTVGPSAQAISKYLIRGALSEGVVSDKNG